MPHGLELGFKLLTYPVSLETFVKGQHLDPRCPLLRGLDEPQSLVKVPVVTEGFPIQVSYALLLEYVSRSSHTKPNCKLPQHSIPIGFAVREGDPMLLLLGSSLAWKAFQDHPGFSGQG